MNTIIDARGLSCPLPVVNTKNKIAELSEGDTVQTIVDNEIAVQNLTKFASVRGYDVKDEQTGDSEYTVTMTITANVPADEESEPAMISCAPAKKNMVAVLSSRCMGNGDDKLGRSLMKAFTFALTKQDRLPDTVLLYNGGAYLSTMDDSVEDLKYLESQGAEVLTCGTCLDFYGLKEELKVGGVTNMYEIVEKMEQADLVIRP